MLYNCCTVQIHIRLVTSETGLYVITKKHSNFFPVAKTGPCNIQGSFWLQKVKISLKNFRGFKRFCSKHRCISIQVLSLQKFLKTHSVSNRMNKYSSQVMRLNGWLRVFRLKPVNQHFSLQILPCGDSLK